VTHEITKEFKKNSYFENMTAGFLFVGSKNTSVKNPEKMHFQQ
jgi:hypothetical protein